MPGTPRGLVVEAPPVVGEVGEEGEPLIDITIMGLDLIYFDVALGAFSLEQEAHDAHIMATHDQALEERDATLVQRDAVTTKR